MTETKIGPSRMRWYRLFVDPVLRSPFNRGVGKPVAPLAWRGRFARRMGPAAFYFRRTFAVANIDPPPPWHFRKTTMRRPAGGPR